MTPLSSLVLSVFKVENASNGRPLSHPSSVITHSLVYNPTQPALLISTYPYSPVSFLQCQNLFHQIFLESFARPVYLVCKSIRPT